MSSLLNNVATHVLEDDPALTARILKVFGRPDDSIAKVQKRADDLLGDYRTIVYEADAQTLQYRYVSASAEDVLGFPMRRWLSEAAFWTDTVVHRDDRPDAVTFCTQQAAQGNGYDLRYRAQTIDGRTITLLDVARVTVDSRGVAERVRGILVEMGAEGRLSPLPPVRLSARSGSQQSL